MLRKKRGNHDPELLDTIREFDDAAGELVKVWTEVTINRFINEWLMVAEFGRNRELGARLALAEFYASLDGDICRLKANARERLSASRHRFKALGHPELFEIFLTNQAERAWQELAESASEIAGGTISMGG